MSNRKWRIVLKLKKKLSDCTGFVSSKTLSGSDRFLPGGKKNTAIPDSNPKTFIVPSQYQKWGCENYLLPGFPEILMNGGQRQLICIWKVVWGNKKQNHSFRKNSSAWWRRVGNHSVLASLKCSVVAWSHGSALETRVTRWGFQVVLGHGGDILLKQVVLPFRRPWREACYKSGL